MSVSTFIPLAEYLQTAYRPDRDYLQGQLRERNMGEQPHAHLQAILAGIFHEHRHTWGVRPLTEQRIQTSSEHFRIADVCVLRSSSARDPILRTAPLLCIEILSRADSLGELQDRVDDYQAMGVEHIWAIDPWKRHGYLASSAGFKQPSDGVLSVPGTSIRVSLAELFAELDEGSDEFSS